MRQSSRVDLPQPVRKAVSDDPLKWLLRNNNTGVLLTASPYQPGQSSVEARSIADTLARFCQAYLDAYPADTYQHRSCAWFSNLFSSVPLHSHGRSDEVRALLQVVRRINAAGLREAEALRRLQLVMYAYVRHRVWRYRNKQSLRHYSLGDVFNFVEALLAMSLRFTMNNIDGRQIWLHHGQAVMRTESRGIGRYRQFGTVNHELRYTQYLDRVAGFSSIDARDQCMRQLSSLAGLKQCWQTVETTGSLLSRAKVSCEMTEFPPRSKVAD